MWFVESSTGTEWVPVLWPDDSMVVVLEIPGAKVVPVEVVDGRTLARDEVGKSDGLPGPGAVMVVIRPPGSGIVVVWEGDRVMVDVPIPLMLSSVVRPPAVSVKESSAVLEGREGGGAVGMVRPGVVEDSTSSHGVVQVM